MSRRQGLFTLIFDMAILLAIIVCFLSIVIPGYEQEYTAGLIEKVEKLENTKGPKIVLIGNSNLAFGINSEKIEEEMGMPVINMGLHGGLGNEFAEEMAKINVEAGDIYVICHSDYGDDSKEIDWVLRWVTIEDKPQLWKLVRGQDIPNMLEVFPVYLKRCIALWEEGKGNLAPKEGYYYREVFNEYGDVAKEREEPRLDDFGVKVEEVCPDIDETCISRLRELEHYLRERGAKMVVAGYPIIVKGNPPEEFLEEIDVFQAQLEEALDGMVISDFRDYCYDEGYFFDSVLHLNDEGAALRTEQLLEDLKSYRQIDEEG